MNLFTIVFYRTWKSIMWPKFLALRMNKQVDILDEKFSGGAQNKSGSTAV